MLDRQRAVVELFPAGGLVEGWVTLVGHDLASDALLAGAADLARELGTSMTMHLSPTSSDPERYLARTGRRPVVHLDHLGVLGPHLLLAHGVWFDESEIELVLSSRTAIAYCPWAYLRLGQGVTRVGRHADIVERGGRVALGCDASNAGDTADILRAAAVAAGIARDGRIDPERFGAHDAFELATIAGAEAVGMADRIGSIEPGKQADLVVHRAVGMGLDTARRRRVCSWCGAPTVAPCATCGSPAARSSPRASAPWSTNQPWKRAAQEAQTALLARAGIEVPHRWPYVDAT